ncbi:MAG: HAMP domain-containing histidine kinase [Proteobacteria bacterium]|nr:HAMP domain-containing histidine kinase [Pseudomonadota bacterium]
MKRRNNVFGTSDQPIPGLRGRRSLVFQQMALVAVVPIGMALVICIAILLRLKAEYDHTLVTKATVASRWIADRLENTEEGKQTSLVDEAAGTLKALIGVFSNDGSPMGTDRFSGFSEGDIKRIIASERQIEKHGGYFVKAAAVGGAGGVPYVLVAVRSGFLDAGTLTALLIRLGPIAIVLLPIGFAFGFFFGTTINRRLIRIKQYLKTMTTEEAMRTKPLVIFDENADGGDLVKLDMAASDLAARFKSEFVLYRDAVEEVSYYDEQRTAFLGTLSKELWAPLVSVVDEAQRLIDGKAGKLEPHQVEDIEIIRKGGERLQSLVQDVNDLSSVIVDGIEYDEEPVDLKDVAEEVVRVARWGIGEKEVDVVLEIEDGFQPRIMGSRRRIWQILTNLVTNGVKFTEQGEVRVRLFGKAPSSAVIEVSDTGPGIPKDAHYDLFDPFAQHGDRKNRRQGTGLGLAICKRLTELHNGEISVSAREEEGSKFTVTLPRES